MLYERALKKPVPSALSRLERYKGLCNEDLAALSQGGDRRALSLLVERNHGLVYGHARRQAHKCTSLTLEDLVSEGGMGVVRAASDYDPSVGANFCTYAMNWVRCYVTRAADKDSTVLAVGGRVRVAQAVPRYARIVEGLVLEGLGYDEAHERARKELKLSAFVAGAVRGFANAKRPRSLDETIRMTGDSGDRTLHDLLADDRAFHSTEEGLDDRGVLERVMGLRAHFGEREQAVFDGRIMGDETLDEVALRFGVTRERVRQIEERLKQKLRKVLSQPRVTRHAVERARAPDGRRVAPPPAESGQHMASGDKRSRGRPRGKLRGRSCPALGGLGKPCGACVVTGDLCTLHTMRRERGQVIEIASQ